MAISLRADVAIHFSKGFNYVCDWKRRLHRLGDNYLTRSGSPRSVSVEFPAHAVRDGGRKRIVVEDTSKAPPNLSPCVTHAAAMSALTWLTTRPPLRSSIMMYRIFALVAFLAWCAPICPTLPTAPPHAFALHLRCIFVVNASVPGRGGGEAPVCASVCAPHARLCVITHARLPLTRSLLPPQHGGFRRPGLGGRDADRRALS